MALVNYGDSDVSDSDCEEASTIAPTTSKFNDSVEDEYRMRIPKNAKPLLTPLNIKRKTTSSGKVLLSIPTVEEFDSSDDSDGESRGQTFKSKQSVVASGSKPRGLLDILPPTRALIVRDGDKPVMQMVPHQVRRPPPPFKKAPKQVADDDVWDDHDDEVDDNNNAFFSFYDAKKDEQKASEAATDLRKQTQDSLVASATVPKAATVVLPGAFHLPTLAVKPFKDSELPPPTVGKRVPIGPLFDSDFDDEPVSVLTEETFIPGPERKRARMAGTSGTVGGASAVAELLASGAVKEIRQDDLTAGSKLELVKNITTGQGNRPKPDHFVDQPGKLAYRKHQITWLAYQAQENEYELQEQWAEARRNQTLSRQKYGF